MSRPRKNKKFIDPRYFMDEKMEVMSEDSYDIETGVAAMSPEEIKEQLSVLEQRINQRMQFLSTNDPQTQRLIGQMEVYKAMSEQSIKDTEGKV